jgi:hypothetical protein
MTVGFPREFPGTNVFWAFPKQKEEKPVERSLKF